MESIIFFLFLLFFKILFIFSLFNLKFLISFLFK